MKYTHITLDVGAAIKAYHVIWNNPNLWSDSTLEQLAHLAVQVALKISCFKLDFAVMEALIDCCLENIMIAAGYYTNRFQKH